MENKTLREDIIGKFGKYCRECKGPCCNRELEEEFIAFDWELEKIPGAAASGLGWSGERLEHIKRVPFAAGDKCPFSGDCGCRLSTSVRPMDCLSYPVYPEVGTTDGGISISGLKVRNNCHYAGEISRDMELLALVRRLWESYIGQITRESLSEWFGDSDYWSDEGEDGLFLKVILPCRE